jgi:NAD(P)-dependent dehydrogenase (short-subunit alcohol dehydrogenase family)
MALASAGPERVRASVGPDGDAGDAAGRGGHRHYAGTIPKQALDVVTIGRMTQLAEPARVAALPAAPESSATTGQTTNICGGQTMD